MNKLDLKIGKWLVSDCGKMPSESNCQLVIMAPADQEEHLIQAGVDHMVKQHGHSEEDARALIAKEGDKMFEEFVVEGAAA